MHNSDVLLNIRKELTGAIDSSKQLSPAKLIDSCPLLNAVFDETLRLCSATASIRTTTKDVEVHGKLIPSGAQIICPFRVLHHNPAVWGQDPGQWNPERFVENQKLGRDPNYRPFGGGLTQCPGRFVARLEALLYISITIERFELDLWDVNSTFPAYDSAPNPGLLAPARGSDLILRVKPRAFEDVRFTTVAGGL